MTSIVITHYNRPEKVERLVSLLPQKYEIIVSDDGSDQIPDLPPWVIFLTHEHQGVRTATVRNRGVAKATSEYVILLDDDVIPEDGHMLVSGHYAWLNRHDFSFGAVTLENFDIYSDRRAHFDWNEEPVWRWGWSANFAVRKSTFDDLGGFDEIYNGGYGYLDIDLARRAHKQGYTMAYNPLAKVLHDGPIGNRPSEERKHNHDIYFGRWKTL